MLMLHSSTTDLAYATQMYKWKSSFVRRKREVSKEKFSVCEVERTVQFECKV